AEQNGFLTREFSVTWPAAVGLLERGIPFTLTTTEAVEGHLQAAIGLDETRGTLLIRDPFVYYTAEFIAEPFFERYRAWGPRGMVMVPRARGELLDGLGLPDAALYDQLYTLQRALEQNHRDDAEGVLQQMRTVAPSHRLTLTARRALASYDTNALSLAACIDESLAQFP